MSDKPNIPDGFIPIEPDEAIRNFQKNIDPSVIQPISTMKDSTKNIANKLTVYWPMKTGLNMPTKKPIKDLYGNRF